MYTFEQKEKKESVRPLKRKTNFFANSSISNVKYTQLPPIQGAFKQPLITNYIKSEHGEFTHLYAPSYVCKILPDIKVVTNLDDIDLSVTESVILRTGDYWDYYSKTNGFEQPISELEFAEIDGGIWLTFANTISDFQKKGLATTLMRAAVKYYKVINVFSGTKEQLRGGDTRYLTQEGADFINSCIKNSILKKEWYWNPYEFDSQN